MEEEPREGARGSVTAGLESGGWAVGLGVGSGEEGCEEWGEDEWLQRLGSSREPEWEGGGLWEAELGEGEKAGDAGGSLGWGEEGGEGGEGVNTRGGEKEGRPSASRISATPPWSWR